MLAARVSRIARYATAHSSGSAIVAVMGGGDAAFDEALYLTKYASKVTIIHRRDEFRAQRVLVDRAPTTPRSSSSPARWWRGSTADGDWSRLTLTEPEDRTRPPISRWSGLFVYIGNIPEHRHVRQHVRSMDENGYIEVDARIWRPDCAGVYVAGDVRKSPLKQVVTAGADGSIAALTADKYLDDLDEGMSPDEAEYDATNPEKWPTSY